jgi:hypothetical protein
LGLWPSARRFSARPAGRRRVLAPALKHPTNHPTQPPNNPNPKNNSNTDESPGVATEFGIRSIPTIMIFKGGQKMETVIGAVPKSTLVQSIEKFL